MAECSDPQRKNYPFRRVCYATMELEAASSTYDDLHKDAPYHDGTFQSWSKERGEAFPYRYTEGVKLGVADHDLAPWDTFTTDMNASPLPDASDEPELDDDAEPSA